ncbi:AcrR family transcriptional regulator [Kribbella aluminosa]|uniref:AcrR family transcriptional regulator n=1 Tax=Kribbella aluminosa TaxID=416017 RepID=A0ABS4UL45_9ACTN|nr:helix-turn-helix domain-containing protein [Kribbella aluminosa]MBP2352373.1 AcrR family transcriptional regulator [Kribbella aluminosa]
MEHQGRRERKKAEVRARISAVATGLFLERGFDEVSVSEVAEAADVARPTVFAHFARKEDLFFDRYPEAEALVVGAINDRTAGTSAVAALSELLIELSDQGHPLSAIRGRFRRFWEVVAESRPLQARARELLQHLEEAIAAAMERTGVPDPQLTAAVAVAAFRTVHLAAVRRILDGEDETPVARDYRARVISTLAAVDRLHG